ncbi:MAG: 3-hydroxyisobutyrate dehydrogenase [Actinomycetota bacterium]
MARIAVLGAGIMGGPMARNLVRAGHEVTIWNRTEAKARALEQDGAHVALSPDAAVADAEIVLTMLADAHAVDSVMLEGGGLAAMADGALWIQSSTVGVAATERLAELAERREVTFVDAPVLGTKKPAEEGQLVMLASGSDEARSRCHPVFRAIARDQVWVGEAGAGTRLKLVVNSWILCTVENIAETFVLCEALGLDPRNFLEAIGGGAMDMQYAHLKGEAMMNEDFPASFPLYLARKDVALILEAAGELKLPLVRATLQQFDRAFELGHGDEDMSAVYYASAASMGAGS